MAENDCTSVGDGVSIGGGLVEGAPASGSAAMAEGPAADQSGPPPITDRGVEFRLHWLTVTIWQDENTVRRWLSSLLDVPGGEAAFEPLPQGARGFRNLSIGPGGCKLYSSPFSGDEFCSVEMNGELISSIDWERLKTKFVGLRCRWQVSRLDMAFDHSDYTPADVISAVEAREVRSLAKRDTLRELREPFRGGHTVYLGSRQSERMLRVYLRDGHTRTELECKKDRANAIFTDLLAVEVAAWPTRGLAHLRDYVDFKTAWWEVFCSGVERAGMKLSKWQELSFARSRAWIEKQVIGTLAMFEQVLGYKAFHDLLEDGRRKWTARHRIILAGCGVAAS